MKREKNRSFKKEWLGVLLAVLAAITVYYFGEGKMRDEVLDILPKNTPPSIAAEENDIFERVTQYEREELDEIIGDYSYEIVEIDGEDRLAVDGPPMGGSDEEQVVLEYYVVKAGDTLWDLAEAFYGDGYKWVDIYNANAVELLARDTRNISQSGHWIHIDQVIAIPSLN